MGRQIRFHQTKQDLNEMELLFKANEICTYDVFGNEIPDGLKSGKIQVFLAPPRYHIKNKYAYEETVEFDLCKEAVKPDLSRFAVPDGYKGINGGRFYIDREAYDNVTSMKIYNTLVKYIKKNYMYFKGLDTYISGDFIKKISEKVLIPTDLNTYVEELFERELYEKTGIII